MILDVLVTIVGFVIGAAIFLKWLMEPLLDWLDWLVDKLEEKQ